MATSLIAEKLEQAAALVAEQGLDVWLTFVRETAENADPALPFLVEGGLTWQSALLVTRDGERVAVVGNYDADPLRASGLWTEVIPYVQGIREPLLVALDRTCGTDPRIGVNFSLDDPKADGLSHGLYLLLEKMLAGTRFQGRLESAEAVVGRLRARKTPTELARIRQAIRETEELFALVPHVVAFGMTERALYDALQAEIDRRGLGHAWDRTNDPIVNFGPDSMIGHGIPSSTLELAPGQVLHIDLGVVREGYASDLQRCWFVAESADAPVPEDVARAVEAVNRAIDAAAEALRPGVPGWKVDQAARETIVAAGYPEYMHAVGHQVGRTAHDGGTILGPRWDRYGNTPDRLVESREVYTLELGVTLPGRGYVGIEEMVVVTETGCEFLSERMRAMPVVRPAPRAR